MRLLILGASGMLGHVLARISSEYFDSYGTVRESVDSEAIGVRSDRLIDGVSVEAMGSVDRAFEIARPDVVVNCIGVVKQVEAANDPIASIAVNALFPHRLAALCRSAGARLIHLSTDCVFSGRRGHYAETDTPDAEDSYGRSKLLGEPTGPSCLTIRSSYIGPEVSTSHGLLEWFLRQRGEVRGFRRAVFSGFTTDAFSRAVVLVIRDYPGLMGLWHVASEPITKFDLLTLLKDAYGVPVQIEADDMVVCDRTLDGARFRETTGYSPPSWPAMVAEMRGRARAHPTKLGGRC